MEKMAFCGLLCGECPVYLATITGDGDLRARLARDYAAANFHPSPGGGHDLPGLPQPGALRRDVRGVPHAAVRHGAGRGELRKKFFNRNS